MLIGVSQVTCAYNLPVYYNQDIELLNHGEDNAPNTIIKIKSLYYNQYIELPIHGGDSAPSTIIKIQRPYVIIKI